MEYRDRFYMGCMREHINDARSFELVAVFVDQGSGIARKCSRVTGDIYNPFWAQEVHTSDNFRRAAACRIEQQAITACLDPGFSAIDFAQIGDAKLDVAQIISLCIGCGPCHQVFVTLDIVPPSAVRARGRVAFLPVADQGRCPSRSSSGL